MATSANDRQHGGDHYKKAGYQYWDYVHDTKQTYLGGNAGKYVFRRKGDRILDLEKAIHYLDKCMEMNITTGPVSDKDSYAFWEFVISNEVNMVDASILWIILAGRFHQAKLAVEAMLEGLRS